MSQRGEGVQTFVNLYVGSKLGKVIGQRSNPITQVVKWQGTKGRLLPPESITVINNMKHYKKKKGTVRFAVDMTPKEKKYITDII